MSSKAFVLLADGTFFEGLSVGVDGTSVGEICFNTGMTGYQEIFTDPSYKGQVMVMASAHIGNYGVESEENESAEVQIAGLVCRNFSELASRVRGNSRSLKNFMKGSVVIANVDTRALVQHIRDFGAQNAVLSTELTVEEAQLRLNAAPNMEGLELCSTVSTKEPYTVGKADAEFNVATLDLGIKRSILRNLLRVGCRVTVYPYNTTFAVLSADSPDGYFLSNGPGDPAASPGVIDTVRDILTSGKPTFGICLGHQMIALASGLSTYKMHNGHRGINHPVKNLRTGKGEITSQNHGFAVSIEDVANDPRVELTHVHLNDGTVAGIRRLDLPAFSVQYHPEASPGPHDAHYLFDEFVALMGQPIPA
ncbi:MAG: glutamine-hydrolyzing carbamoyl-phosphate synthase small subunit [Bacteroidota bacterium]